MILMVYLLHKIVFKEAKQCLTYDSKFFNENGLVKYHSMPYSAVGGKKIKAANVNYKEFKNPKYVKDAESLTLADEIFSTF